AAALHEAQARRHAYVGGEHILLAISGAQQGVLPLVFARLGIDPAALYARLDTLVGLADEPPPQIALAPSAERVIEAALREARHLHQNHIGAAHLLLGLLRDGASLAAQA